jgi:hypothetical protein
VRVSQIPDLRMGWRQMYAEQEKTNGGSSTASGSVRPAKPAVEERARPWAQPAEVPVEVEDPAVRTAGLGLVAVVRKAEPEGAVVLPPQPTLAEELKKKQQRQQFTTLVGVGVLIAVVGGIAALWFGSAPTVPVEDGASAAPVAAGTAKPVVTSQPVVGASTSKPVLEDTQPVVVSGQNTAGTGTVKTTVAPRGTGKAPVKTTKKKESPFGGSL